jgi:predicted amidophosphoribosyltransferase
VVFLLKSETAGFFTIFQSARLRKQMGTSVEGSGPQLEFLARQKFERLPMQLAEKVTGPIDAIVRLPSDHRWQAEPYHAALLEKFPEAVDLTDRLSRPGDCRSNLDATMPQIKQSHIYQPKGDEGTFRSLLIVDDTLRTGNSVAAMIGAFLEKGLRDDCWIVLARPLWIIPKERKPVEH